MRRLTYVALTRAEDEIFITNSSYEVPKDVEEYLPGGTKNADSIYKVLAPVIDFYSKTPELIIEIGNCIHQRNNGN